jgi:hypothetical protein
MYVDIYRYRVYIKKMSRKIKYGRLSLLNIFETVNEVFDKNISTDFKIIDYGDYISYNFKTNSNTEYDLELHYTNERCDTILSNGEELGSMLPNRCIDGEIEGFDVAFTLTEVSDKDNPEEFEKETNKHEYIELFGRITNILKKVVTKHRSYDLFVVGFSRRNKLKIYEQIFENHFKNEFDLLYGKSQHHPSGKSLFIIRKK